MVETGWWQLSDVLAATGGELTRLEGPRRFVGVSTDTRRIRQQEIFVALRGANHDGHGFVDEAVDRGAAAVVVERGTGCRPEAISAKGSPASVVEVGDTLRALGDLAAHYRRKLGFTVAAVTGSNGKTTTKEMIAAIMDGAFGPENVLRTTGTENNLIGVPLTLLRATGRERVAVIEFGMNAPGEIWRLTEIAEPDVGVVTCVAPAHIEGLGSIAGVARAKGELYQRLRPGATAVVNGDDTWVRQIGQGFTGRTVFFGSGTSIAADEIELRGLDGIAFTLVVDGERRRLYLPLPGRHNVTNALAATAVALECGVPLDAVVSGLLRSPRLPMRMEIVTLPGQVTVINDAYNANVASMRSALAMLGAMGDGAKIAVLGEMRELGQQSAEFHREVGRAAAAEHVSLLIAVGSEAEEVLAGALESGMEPDAALSVGSHQEAAARVRERVRPGDFVLIKGSRGARMERVLSHLQEGA
jgi:UDP-N-acetylmuramoyl-tripeptide--D-alanyl-D-alanine ligase